MTPTKSKYLSLIDLGKTVYVNYVSKKYGGAISIICKKNI